ncbi:FKBP-type peptidyl-prolyl cis-trans isomerase [Streptomyces sp. A1136]|uniref:FKBP-type peptidyl-prolyl cis-trans isomerase n=1 Tax=Streptomyces sp. A1136 TaxID=2563102 RepID=UPI0034D3317F
MGVTKKVVKKETARISPGQTTPSRCTTPARYRGKKLDSSVDRGTPFVTKIGVGRVIRGWEEGVPAMSLGEKARLTVTSDYGYGDRGYPGLIPPQRHARLRRGAPQDQHLLASSR